MKYAIITPLLLATSLSIATLQAAEIPKDPKKQTTWGLYVDSKEVATMKKELGDKMLFIDVRDPVEIMFTGFTDLVDINIPFKTADRSTWHKKKPVFNMVVNKNFEKDIESALKERGLNKDAPIAIMCRSGGTRGAPATKLLEGKGYKNIYVVTDGFEGGTVKKGEKKNWRIKNGWKNANLPWSYKLNQEKMYMPNSKQDETIVSSDSATTTVSTTTTKMSKAAKKAAFMPVVKHASPMPNYMRTLKKNADSLKLSTEQSDKLKAWVAANNKKAADTVNKIVELEKGISLSSMKGDSKEILMTKFNEMSDLRMKLASSKTACRDNIRSILSSQQWNTLIKIQEQSAKKAALN